MLVILEALKYIQLQHVVGGCNAIYIVNPYPSCGTFKKTSNVRYTYHDTIRLGDC